MSDPVRIIVGEGDSVEINVPGYGIIAGRDGPPGPQGEQGEDGKSAYEVAVDNGFVGTPEEWLESLKGETGKSAYESAVDGGYTGTEAEFNAELADIEAAAQTASTAAEAAVAAQEAAEDAQEAAEDAQSAAETAATHYPKIEDGTWHVWDAATGTYVDTEINATGPQGTVGPGVPAGGAVGDVLVKNGVADYSARWEKPQTPRRNMLDNWYFVYGKTIDTSNPYSNVDTFPINQRGQTSYQGAVFGIDRWYVTSGSSSQVTIDTDGVIFKNTANTNRFSQHAPISLAGKTVTLSARCTAIDGARYAVTIQTNGGNSTTTFTTDKITSVTFTVPLAATEINAQIRLEDADASVKIHAMKLELGSYQTLAHNEGTEENPDWVLNELPDYGEELVKCNVADGKTVEYTDRFLVLESTYEYARDLTWTAIGGGIAYSAKMQFTFNGATATTVPGYRAVAATIARFSNYRPDYQWVPYIYNTGEVCIYSAVGASPTDFIASSHISVRVIFEKT